MTRPDNQTKKLVRSVTVGPGRVYWYCVLGIVGWAFLRWWKIDATVPQIQLGPFLATLGVGTVNLGVRSWASLRRDQGGIAQRLYYRLGWVFVAVDMLCLAIGRPAQRHLGDDVCRALG
jgi:hypothetical protein